MKSAVVLASLALGFLSNRAVAQRLTEAQSPKVLAASDGKKSQPSSQVLPATQAQSQPAVQPQSAVQPQAAAQPQATGQPPTGSYARSLVELQSSSETGAILGVGGGFGFTPLPTSRFELDFLFNSPHILSISFEASTFSNEHFLAKSMLIENYERDVKRRRWSLHYRSVFHSKIYYTVGLGIENYVAKLLGPSTEYSREYKTIIAGVRQGYTFSVGLGQAFQRGPLSFRIEWIGLSLLRKSRDLTFFDASADATTEKIEEAKSKLKKDTPDAIRLMNISASYEF